MKLPLLNFFRPRPVAEKPSLPAGLRAYAIGDIHGRADLLTSLLAEIERDLQTAPAEVKIVYLGDYLDRGPESARVIDLVRSAHPAITTALRGNHEQMFLRFLDDCRVLGDWRRNGGLETLHSYGLNVSEALRGEGFEEARQALLRVLPVAHREFLESTSASFSIGDYFFCHAGVKPDVPLEEQSPDDLYWIREPFLSHRGSFGRVVVHGHTPVEKPDVRSNRINIDTGAFATSCLTCLVLEGEEIRFLATHRKPKG